MQWIVILGNVLLVAISSVLMLVGAFMVFEEVMEDRRTKAARHQEQHGSRGSGE